jgi:hypothetical protein
MVYFTIKKYLKYTIYAEIHYKNVKVFISLIIFIIRHREAEKNGGNSKKSQEALAYHFRWFCNDFDSQSPYQHSANAA